MADPRDGADAARAGRTRNALIVLAAAGALALTAAVAWQFLGKRPPAPAAPASAPIVATFVGSDRCKLCHADQSTAWATSQHALAMQHASASTVRGDFNDARFTFDGVTSHFTRRAGKFYVRTDGPDGKPAEFEVKYTFGVEPLQQYLVELPGGRLQALALSWDTRPKAAGGQRWFRQYPAEKIDFRDELHWTRRAQNWNFMCADCHSTNVQKRYDAATGEFATTWSEITAGCESCHGPGSAHLSWAAGGDRSATNNGLVVAFDERRGMAWPIDAASGVARRSAPRSSEREIEVCAQCHARRAQIAEGYRAGQPFLDHYLPALLTPGLYHADGQQRDEVFVWGSFLQSRMYRAGVTCSDCHDPHTLKLRAAGNAVCGQCHAPGRYDARSHHFHDPASAAGRCVSCHMPATTYMVVDPRRDHSLRVPRPDRSVALGVPNACNDCHRENDARWAAAAVRRWYARDAGGFQTFAETFDQAERRQPRAAASLVAIADDVSQAPIVRASALERLGELGDPVRAEVVVRGARDASPLVRLAAVRLAAALPASERATAIAPLLGDPRRAIRTESARVLAPLPASALTPDTRAAWSRAADEYLATLAYTADRPESRVALATFHSDRGEIEPARAAFAEARKLDPAYLPAYLNEADLLRTEQRESEAQALLEAGLAKAPRNASLHHALGLSFVRQKQPAAALPELQRAAELAPEVQRYVYVYAVALNSYGRRNDAIRVLERATTRWPADRDILTALVTMQRDAGRNDAARRSAQALANAYPDDQQVRALLQQLR